MPALTDGHCEFRCIHCQATYAIDFDAFTCSECGDLLEVSHNTEALTSASADEWRALFAERTIYAPYPHNSGVWAKREWIAPHIGEEHIVTLGEGNTPLVDTAHLADDMDVSKLWIKQCGLSHSGSFKDLGMTVLISHVRYLMAKGRSIPAVICASTGDTSAALGTYAALAKVPAIVLLPKGKISAAQLVQPIASGATVIGVDTDFDGCMALVKRLVAEAGLYLANSMNSLRLEGQKTVAFETMQQLAWQAPDWIVIPGGNLGNVSALAAGLDILKATGLIDKSPRIAVAQAEHANPLFLSFTNNFESFSSVRARKTVASAIQIGAPVSYKKAIAALKRYDGVVAQASEQELADACAVADQAGQFTCPHTGVALAVTRKLRESGDIKKSDKVVVISTANGLKFSDFKTHFHENELAHIDSGELANRPIYVDDDFDKVVNAIRSHAEVD